MPFVSGSLQGLSWPVRLTPELCSVLTRGPFSALVASPPYLSPNIQALNRLDLYPGKLCPVTCK